MTVCILDLLIPHANRIFTAPYYIVIYAYCLFGAITVIIAGGCATRHSPNDVVHAQWGCCLFQHGRLRIPGGCSLRDGPFLWPVPFPDIKPFFVWGRLRLLFCEAPVEQDDDLPRIQAALHNIRHTPDTFEPVQESIVRRCGLCNEVGGRH
jgi:hypothetical protein